MNILPTGTATRWRSLDEYFDERTRSFVYIYDLFNIPVEGPEYLAEQLRVDGAAPSIGVALSMSEQAELSYELLYLDDNDDETLEPDEASADDTDGRLVLVARVRDND